METDGKTGNTEGSECMSQRRNPSPAAKRPGTPAKRPAPAKKQAKRPAWLAVQLKKRPLPVWIVILADILALGVALLVFAYFHHVKPRATEAVGITSTREMAAQVQTAATQAPAPETVQTDMAAQANTAAQTTQADPVGYFGNKFADKFTSGEVIQDGWNYQSANLNISTTIQYEYDSKIYVCDIYVKDIESFATGFAYETFGRNYGEDLSLIAQRENAIVSINGDYYGAREDGVVIRNGVLYRDDGFVESDMCILYWDGTMKTFPAGGVNAKAEMAAGAYQSWAFGPELLDANSEPKAEFNIPEAVASRNPRTALGYFEPGHYCFVVVDGRSSESRGLPMKNLSQLMYLLGCKTAYNMDGGKTSQMLWGTQVINSPYEGGRNCSDILLIREP